MALFKGLADARCRGHDGVQLCCMPELKALLWGECIANGHSKCNKGICASGLQRVFSMQEAVNAGDCKKANSSCTCMLHSSLAVIPAKAGIPTAFPNEQ
ncbi:MAG: hypothetical protein GX660_28545 [Clostridiaceae bacterium]|nr:hypothetical protein [Clostridiaceae bacterium]